MIYERLEDVIEIILARHGGSWTWDGRQDDAGVIMCSCLEWRGCIADHRKHVASMITQEVQDRIDAAGPQHSPGCKKWTSGASGRGCVCSVSSIPDRY